MATKTEITIEEKLKALYELQMVDSEIDKIRILRGELPLEVQDLEDEIEGLQTRVTNFEDEMKSLQGMVQDKKSAIKESEGLIKKYEEERAAKEGGPPAGKQIAMDISQRDMLLTNEQAESFMKKMVELEKEYKELSNENLQKDNFEGLYFEVTKMIVPQYQRKINKE